MPDILQANIHIIGIVQGVGFRPFVYNLATRYGLKGWVKNTSSGVDIVVEGQQEEINFFIQSIKTEAPPLADIVSLDLDYQSPSYYSNFEIVVSESREGEYQPIPSDVGICQDCLQELLDPADRRFHYPFINCTNCGPRFTIIKDIPYDRPYTTMSTFKMCPDCSAEYNNPIDRRFHAQPVACPICGPKVWIQEPGKSGKCLAFAGEAIDICRKLLSEGKIVAVKGLGGFHLACDATNKEAVRELRKRKMRVEKPFALMMPDIPTVRKFCKISLEEQGLLESYQRPIVLLEKKTGTAIVDDVSPGQNTHGVMLPYTPLHHLLFKGPDMLFSALVMTSGNLSEEPIAVDNDEAIARLSQLCDAFLLHDREIFVRCDDSVARVIKEASKAVHESATSSSRSYLLRRSRGYAPKPIILPMELPSVLAVGPEIKNTFCLTRNQMAFLSHHIGDMENYETLESFVSGISHYERLFRIKPDFIIRDLHPDYLTTRYARQRGQSEGIPVLAVQHHHAHVAACMADNKLNGEYKVIGLAFDGTGFGVDQAIWGGEVLIADYEEFQRRFHLDYFPLPGGDTAIKEPAKTALALLWSLGLDWNDSLFPVNHFRAAYLSNLLAQLEGNVNAPKTSSIGRLFDAAASLAGVRQAVNYEAQAAMEFESAIADGEKEYYPFEIMNDVFSPKKAVQHLIRDIYRGVSIPVVSARFHNGLVHLIRAVCDVIRTETDIRSICLSGGVWQNVYLLKKTIRSLQLDGFEVFTHKDVPTNDGGLALGQAVAGAFHTMSIS